MYENALKDKILSLLDSHKTGTLATVRQDKPYSRYMDFYHDGFTLYTASNKETHKVTDLKDNPNVHILIGYEGEGIGDAFLEIEGQAAISSSPELKQKLWKDDFGKWFKSPEDPEYIVLEITPEAIRLMNSAKGEHETLKLG